jgi:CheY-like chemotaxis protein
VLTLPRGHEAPQLVGLPGGEGAHAEALPMRVLVADDNRDNAMSWAILIEGMGHQVAVAYDGLSAVQSASLMQPQVLLLDIGMPHLDGYEVARRIRATDWGQDAYLVAVTGWGQAKDRAMAKEAGFDEHYTKPLDPDHLETLLRKASHRARQALREAPQAVRAV